MSAPTLNDWVWVEAMLIQSLVGAISFNVRRINLSFDSGEWKILAVLERPNDQDVADFEYTADDVEDLVCGIKDRLSESAYANVSVSVCVSDKPLRSLSNDKTRTVYLRKDSFQQPS